MVTSSATRDGLKGRPPPRQRPDDFDVIFVEKGRESCEPWYRARKTTITRWLDETLGGREVLIAKRAAYVKSMRSQGMWLTRSSRLVEVRVPKAQAAREAIRDRRKVSPTLCRHAAQFLRISRNGGRIVSMAQNGDWWVGTKRLSPAQLLDLAVSKGFDRDMPVEPMETDSDRSARIKPNAIRQMGADRSAWEDSWNARWLHEGGNADFAHGRDWQKDDDDLSPDLHPQSGRKVKPGR